MPDSYLIDGYNLIHALGLLAGPVGPYVLEHARRRLLDFLKESFGDDAAQVSIIFDARKAPPHVARQQTYHGLRLHFAPSNCSADDLIETLIDAHPSPRSLVVFSNDSRLWQHAATSHGARAWTHTLMLDFLERRMKPEQPLTSSGGEEKSSEPLSSEETSRWLKEFESLEADPELKEFFDLDRFEDDPSR